MKYFTINELCASSTAKAKGINNIPSPEITGNLTKLTDNLLDPIRERWGKPINVNSGYRSPQLNKAIGGVKNSQHLQGLAADITTGTKQGNQDLFNMILAMKIPFDQLIDESNFAWVHISYNHSKNRNQVLHL